MKIIIILKMYVILIWLFLCQLAYFMIIIALSMIIITLLAYNCIIMRNKFTIQNIYFDSLFVVHYFFIF